MNIIRWTLLARLKWITVELYSRGLSEYLGTTSFKPLARALVQRLWFSNCLYVCLWLCVCFSCTVSRNAWEWDLFVIWVSQGFSNLFPFIRFWSENKQCLYPDPRKKYFIHKAKTYSWVCIWLEPYMPSFKWTYTILPLSTYFIQTNRNLFNSTYAHP